MKEDFDKTLYLEHDNFLSFRDLQQIDDWRDVLLNEDTKRLEEILYTNGADLAYGYSIESCNHRPKTASAGNDAQFGPLIRFKTRTDKWWIDNVMEAEDIARVHPSSFVRAGMRESLNMGVNLNDIIEEQLSTHTRLLEMKQLDKEKK